MKTAKEWLHDKCKIDLPEGEIQGTWFFEHGLPMIVECASCGSTMILPCAYINREGYTYCPSCAGH